MAKVIKAVRRHSRRRRQKSSVKKPEQRMIGGFIVGPLLGIGGYAVVHLGKHHKTGQKVALKILKADKHGKLSDSKIHQSDNAIDLLRDVDHVNVLKLVGFEKDTYFPESNGAKTKCIMMALENAPSGELFDYLMYTGHFDEITSRSYFRQLISGLGAIHDAGYTHRDLKPENLLLDKDYNLKIADFGFASGQTKMRTACGTKGYLAPELIKGKKYDCGVDIFAAGIILFIMYAGFPPFNDAISTDWWWNRLENGWKERKRQTLLDRKGEWSRHGLFWAAHSRSMEFPDDLKAFLLKLFHWNPNDRPSCKDIETKDRVYYITPKELYGKREEHLRGKEKYETGLSWFNKPIKTAKQLGRYLEDRRKEVFKQRATKIDEQQRDIEHQGAAQSGKKAMADISQKFDPSKESYLSYTVRQKLRDVVEQIDKEDEYFDFCQDWQEDGFVSRTPYYFLTEFDPAIVMAAFEMIAVRLKGETEHFPKESRMTIQSSVMKEASEIKLEAQFEVSVFAYDDNKYLVNCKRIRGDPLAFKEIIEMYLASPDLVQIIYLGEQSGKGPDIATVAKQAEVGTQIKFTLSEVPDLE